MKRKKIVSRSVGLQDDKSAEIYIEFKTSLKQVLPKVDKQKIRQKRNELVSQGLEERSFLFRKGLSSLCLFVLRLNAEADPLFFFG